MNLLKKRRHATQKIARLRQRTGWIRSRHPRRRIEAALCRMGKTMGRACRTLDEFGKALKDAGRSFALWTEVADGAVR